MGVHAVQGADVDDPSPALLLQDGVDRVHGPEGAQEADRKAVLHQRFGLLLDATDAAPAPGVVHEDVDRAEPVDGGSDHVFDARLVAGVGLDEEGVLAELFGGALARVRGQLRDHDPCTFFYVALCDAAADAEARARHYGDSCFSPPSFRIWAQGISTGRAVISRSERFPGSQVMPSSITRAFDGRWSRM